MLFTLTCKIHCLLTTINMFIIRPWPPSMKKMKQKTNYKYYIVHGKFLSTPIILSLLRSRYLCRHAALLPTNGCSNLDHIPFLLFWPQQLWHLSAKTWLLPFAENLFQHYFLISFICLQLNHVLFWCLVCVKFKRRHTGVRLTFPTLRSR